MVEDNYNLGFGALEDLGLISIGNISKNWERLRLSYITNSPSLIKGRGIKGEGYLIKV